MAEKEKIAPEAEEVKAEETAAEEVKAEETAAEAAPAEEKAETKEEKAPVEEKAPKAEKAPKEKKPAGKKLPIIIGAVVAVVIVALLVVTIVMGTMATGAYKKGDYAAAYKNSQLALFLASGDKDVIAEAYVTEVLCKEGKFFTAAEVLDKTGLSDEDKNEIYASEPELALCVPGQVVKFGKYETDNNAANGPEDLEWIVLDVVEENGQARALLMTKDVVGNPEGWNKYADGNTSYAESNLNDWCESDFYITFSMYDASLKEKILKIKVPTADSSTGVDSGEDVAVYAYAPAKEDLDKYLTGDLAQYIKASPTASAKAAGVTAYGKEQIAQYYLRNAGNFENNAQWAAGIDKSGAFSEGLSMSGSSTGARVCINVDLGSIK